MLTDEKRNSLIKLHEELFALLERKSKQVDESEGSEKTYNLGRIQNRRNDVENFIAFIEHADEHPDTVSNFMRRYSEIRAAIEEIKV